MIATADAKFLQLSNYLGCKKFLMGNATTVADFALYDALKWHNALDGHLVSKYGNIVEYIGTSVMRVGSDTLGDPIFQMDLQN